MGANITPLHGHWKLVTFIPSMRNNEISIRIELWDCSASEEACVRHDAFTINLQKTDQEYVRGSRLLWVEMVWKIRQKSRE